MHCADDMRSDVLTRIVLLFIVGVDISRAVPERATTLRPFVPVRGAGVLLRMALRATTRRPFVPVYAALRPVDMFVALRLVFCVGRGTTRRPGPIFVVFTTVSIRFDDCDGVTPGFKFVRILLFIYGYI